MGVSMGILMNFGGRCGRWNFLIYFYAHAAHALPDIPSLKSLPWGYPSILTPDDFKCHQGTAPAYLRWASPMGPGFPSGAAEHSVPSTHQKKQAGKCPSKCLGIALGFTAQKPIELSLCTENGSFSALEHCAAVSICLIY